MLFVIVNNDRSLRRQMVMQSRRWSDEYGSDFDVDLLVGRNVCEAYTSNGGRCVRLKL